MEVTLTYERSTKNTFVYSTDNEFSPIKTLYLSKTQVRTAFGEPPAEIVVTVMAAIN